jgi:hypothetical protein
MVEMRTIPVAARLVRVNGGVVEHFAGGIDDGQLAAGADAGVDAHGDVLAGRGGEQQVFEVAAEDADCFFLGALAQLVHQFKFEVGVDLDLPGPAHGVGQPFVGRADLRLDAETHGDALLAGVGARFDVASSNSESSTSATCSMPSLRPRSRASARCEGMLVTGSLKSNQSRNLAPFIFFAFNDG